MNRVSALATALLLVLLGAACSGRGCGSAKPAGEADPGAAPPAQVAGAAGSAASAKLGINGPGLRRSSTDALQLPVPRAFDLSHVESAHFAVALGKDPSRVFEFVRDQIAFESYVGSLRGPRGTLLAMAGNSVDRAALLASLLLASGQRMRFARGILPDDAARRLVYSMWDYPPPVLAASEAQAPDIVAAGDRLVAGVRRDGTMLRDVLSRSGHPARAEPAVTTDSLVRETLDHYWVQWWHDNAWLDLDPSFVGARPGDAYARTQETFDALPEKVFHHVELRIRVEEYAGDNLTTRVVLQHAARSADLSGVSVVLTHAVEHEKSSGASRIVPRLLIGQEQVAGSAFMVQAPRTPAAAAMLDALGGGDDALPPVATAESIEMDFIAPGGSRETVGRAVFDRLGKAERRLNHRVGADDVSRVTGAVNIGEIAQGIYSILFTTGAIDAGHLSGLAALPAQPKEEPIDVVPGLRRLTIAFAAVSDALLRTIGDTPERACRTYADTPRVLIAEYSARSGVSRFSLDLRRDEARAVAPGPPGQRPFSARLLRGVVDGTLERVLMEHFIGTNDELQAVGAPASFSTSLAFERAQAGGVPAVVLAGDSSGLGAGVPADARAWIDDALAAGRLVIAPQRSLAVGGTPRFAWWQVDPRSGVTTAVTDEGLHQDVVEATIVRMDNRIGIVFRVNGRYLPRPTMFTNAAQAERFVMGMQRALGRQAIDVLWRAIL